MTTATTTTVSPHSGRSDARRMTGPERARYTVRWYQDGCRPESTSEGRPRASVRSHR